MIKFKLHIPNDFQINVIKTESELIADIDEYLEGSDDFSLFFASTYFICEQITLISNSFLKIKGYGLNWNNYIYYLNDILPELVASLKFIKMNKSFTLMFYEQGSERVLNFEFFDSNKYMSYCTNLTKVKRIGVKEYIESKYLYLQFDELINEYCQFTNLIYPMIYKDYIHPYISKSLVSIPKN